MAVEEVSLLRSSKLAEGMAVVKVVGGVPVLLLRHEGKPRAYVAVCPHKYYALCSMRVVDGYIECPGHGERFKAEDGSPTRGISTQPLTRIEAFEREGRVYIRADFAKLAAMLASETAKR